MKAICFKTFLILTLFGYSSSLVSQNKTAAVSKSVTVYVFLSETCPICQSYTLTLKELYKKYKDYNIRFVGVFPNYYTTQASIDEFRNKYSIPFELIFDTKGELTKHFKASITPEVFVENTYNQILYKGRIDDSFYAVSKRRTATTTSELADVLSQIVSNQKIKTSVTQAVGCIITSSK